MKIKILDLFCGVGGCSVGYHQGFSKYGYQVDITGVDIAYQRNYPYKFIQSDAISFLRLYGDRFDFIHASPPCQFYSSTACLNPDIAYPELIGDVRKWLLKIGKPYIIENVQDAANFMLAKRTILICGLMVDVPMPRHRLFENSMGLPQPPHPKHRLRCGKMGRPHREGDYYPSPCGNFPQRDLIKSVMGLHHAKVKKEIAQAIPPAYTSFLVDLMLNPSILR
jgi:DNA (cytosine-5)-methyltransferase 1